ncbi:hypothetical protein COCNU_scaffold011895G000010 [Cocos nucifera]|nr:hypothetical protein [Cocos nucifera]
MQRLHDTTLVPNHTLHQLIDQWLLAGADLNSLQKPTRLIDDHELSLSMLKQNLQSLNATHAMKLQALKKSACLALATLELLLGLEAGKQVVIKNLNAVQVLVKLVFRVSCNQEGSENTIGSLLIMCCNSAWVRMEVVNAGLLTQLLLLLQSPCSSRAKTKARALLKLLRSTWAEDPEGGNFHNGM